MTLFLSLLLLLLIAISTYSLSFALRERRRRKGRPLIDNSPVKMVDCEEIDPVFARSDLGPGLQTEAVLIGDLGAYASTSLSEAWVLCVMAKNARTIFEFGTCTGRTTYLLARNAPADAVVGTITLTPDTVNSYKSDTADPDSETWTQQAVAESSFTRFLYNGTEEEQKIKQFFGDSKAFDESEWVDKCDLVFIDGSHAYSYVKSDTEKALRMIKDNGVIFWHDFSPACPGVWKYLSGLGETYPVKHIRNTRLCYLRKEAS